MWIVAARRLSPLRHSAPRFNTSAGVSYNSDIGCCMKHLSHSCALLAPITLWPKVDHPLVHTAALALGIARSARRHLFLSTALNERRLALHLGLALDVIFVMLTCRDLCAIRFSHHDTLQESEPSPSMDDLSFKPNDLSSSCGPKVATV